MPSPPVDLTESLRVYHHLLGAETLARSTDVRALGGRRALLRHLLLDELAVYRKRLRYPKNRDFRRAKVPYFIDADGTRCAMAHLLEVGGQHELVSKIAQSRNHATVFELADDADLVAWLTAAGISLKEAARIQPSYCLETPAQRCFCNGLMSHEIGEGTVVTAGSVTSNPPVAAVIRVDRWNGSESGLKAGDQVQLYTSDAVGTTMLLTAHGPVDSGSQVSEVALVSDNNATCLATLTDGFSQRHPIPVMTLESALQADDVSACEAKLAAVDRSWTTSPCEGGCGCGLRGAPAGGTALTTAAILAAVLCYRRTRVRS